MDLFTSLEEASKQPLKCIDMHTTGGPVRILFKGFPAPVDKTLGEIQSLAKSDLDYIRCRLMHEPRGHREMFGVIPIKSTELTRKPLAEGGAHIGVLFMHHDGYTTMCGHVTFGLARFLVDTHDRDVFPRRDDLLYDPQTLTTEVRIHAPCGLLKVTVPVLPGGQRCDPNRDISIVSVPSFCTAYNMLMKIPSAKRWPQLQSRDHVKIDIIYGGMYFLHVSAQELGFPQGFRGTALPHLAAAGKLLQETMHADPDILRYFRSPDIDELPATIGILIRDDQLGQRLNSVQGVETAILFYGPQYIDRSPCGSGTAARAALAYVKGERKLGERWGYHSMLSVASGGQGLFVGTILHEVEIPGPAASGSVAKKGVVVAIEGRSYYCNLATFIAEETDGIAAQGFAMHSLPEVLAKL